MSSSEIRGGLYNALLGQHPLANALLVTLDLRGYGHIRYRDAWVRKVDGRYEIVMLTRNGGGNREHCGEEGEAGPDCDCTGCAITHKLPAHPLWIGDADDEFDITYAYVYFRVTDGIAVAFADTLELAASMEPPSLRERWDMAMKQIAEMTPGEKDAMLSKVDRFVQVITPGEPKA